jgi:hypothetical protein
LPIAAAMPGNCRETRSYQTRVRIRVSDTFGYTSTSTSLGTFSITYVPPAAPDSVVVDTSRSSSRHDKLDLLLADEIRVAPEDVSVCFFLSIRHADQFVNPLVLRYRLKNLQFLV